MKMPSWLKKTKKNGEAVSSLVAHRRHRSSSSPPTSVLLLHDLPPLPHVIDVLATPEVVVLEDDDM
jgi:hypothetical protein